jgi:hypothetical protein
MIASGILVNEHEKEQAQKLHDNDAKGKVTPVQQNLDASSDTGPRDQVC